MSGNFTPDYILEGVFDITEGLLSQAGAEWVAVDLDNTLAFDNSDEMPAENKKWLLAMKSCGVPVIIISNNNGRRVSGFAEKTGFDYISKAKKPFGDGLKRAAEKLGLPLSRGLMAGDQIFTDVWAARHNGMKSALVRPLRLEKHGFFVVKRMLEMLTKAGRSRGRRAREK